MTTRLTGRARRKRRIRKKVFGTPERPRLTVFRSNRQIYVQVIDDFAGKTLACASSLSVEKPSGEDSPVNKTGIAKTVGAAIAAACKQKGIERVVFDRSGYLYHGRIKSLADAAREGGLKF